MTPIRLWMQQLTGGGIALTVGSLNILAGSSTFKCYLLFAAGGVLAAMAAYTFATDRSRIQMKYYDRDN
jgi:hypothetical protein